MKKALGHTVVPLYKSSMENSTRQLLFDLTSGKFNIEEALLKCGAVVCLNAPS